MCSINRLFVYSLVCSIVCLIVQQTIAHPIHDKLRPSDYDGISPLDILMGSSVRECRQFPGGCKRIARSLPELSSNILEDDILESQRIPRDIDGLSSVYRSKDRKKYKIILL